MCILASVVGVDFNVLEVLWVINHIQYKTVSDASGGIEPHKKWVTYMIVNRNHWMKVWIMPRDDSKQDPALWNLTD